jgi:ubiquinone/menaquinone biosynthesis C-methylase UbiE
MTHVPLDAESLDATVFSLSLIGSNFIDYLKEAHRCLKLDGHLWIAELTSRIQDITVFHDLLFRLGFDVRHTSEKSSPRFTFIQALKTDSKPNMQAVAILQSKLILV